MTRCFERGTGGDSWAGSMQGRVLYCQASHTATAVWLIPGTWNVSAFLQHPGQLPSEPLSPARPNRASYKVTPGPLRSQGEHLISPPVTVPSLLLPRKQGPVNCRVIAMFLWSECSM